MKEVNQMNIFRENFLLIPKFNQIDLVLSVNNEDIVFRLLTPTPNTVEPPIIIFIESYWSKLSTENFSYHLKKF